ncbi:hypothetical protein BGZ75_001789, partial [Mortierella antarctica]
MVSSLADASVILPLSLHQQGKGSYKSLDTTEESDLLSHLDTPEMHFTRLHSELGGSGFVTAKCEELRSNPVFARFFAPKSVRPGHSDDEISDDEDPGDPDFHSPSPLEVLTEMITKTIGRGCKSRKVNFHVRPSAGSESSDAELSGIASSGNESSSGHSENDRVENAGTRRTQAEMEERGEILRKAAEILLEDTRLLEERKRLDTIESLEIAYDCTMACDKIYFVSYLKEQLAEKA